jgi:outer membrane biosynthesis protein TonB
MKHLLIFAFLLAALVDKASSQTDTTKASFGNYPDIQEYVQRNIIYPFQALEQKIRGTVEYKIRINKSGCLDSIVIITNPHDLLTNEVKRVISATACTWTPSYYKNEPIDSWINTKAVYMIKGKR